MSFSISASALTGSDFGNFNQIVGATSQIKATIAQLTAETSSGYLSSDYAGLGQAAAPALNIDAQLANIGAVQANATSAATEQQLAQTALGQIQTLAGNIAGQAATLTSFPGSVGTIASAAQGALQQVASLLDTKFGDVYIFAGQDSTTPPIPNPGTITQSAFYAAIQTAVANLTTNGAAATSASTLASASPGGTSPFSASLEANGVQSQVDLGGDTRVTLAPLANANSDVVSTGTGTTSTGSYTRDILLGLANLASLTTAQSSDPNFLTFVQSSSKTLQGAVSAIGTDIGVLGTRQQVVTSAQTDLTATSTALTTQLSNLQDADLTQVATRLSQAQTQLQASYQILSSLSQLSLAKFLPA